MSNDRRPQSIPFWDWIQSFDPSQNPARGVDSNSAPAFTPFMDSFPFGGPGFGGPGGHRGPHPRPHPPPPPHGHPHHPHHPPGPHPPPPPPPGAEGDWGTWFHTGPYRGPQGYQAPHRSESVSETGVATPTTEQDKSETVNPADVPDPEEVAPEENHCGARPQGPGRGRGRHHRGGPGRRGGCGPRSGSDPHHGSESHPPPYSGPAFDLSSMFRGMASHPLFRHLQDPSQAAKDDSNSDSNSFTPPVDVFNTEKSFVLHVALPGAKKEDVGVNWDPEHGLLKISGVVHRPGDEAFLKTLTRGERTVGVFERNVPLPPDGSKDEVDGFGITAKMEDGVLVITVPKVEKEWTEIHKVDIE